MEKIYLFSFFVLFVLIITGNTKATIIGGTSPISGYGSLLGFGLAGLATWKVSKENREKEI